VLSYITAAAFGGQSNGRHLFVIVPFVVEDSVRPSFAPFLL
jgi:hypothetical protein